MNEIKNVEESLLDGVIDAEYTESHSCHMCNFTLSASAQEVLTHRCKAISDFIEDYFGGISNFFHEEYEMKIAGEQIDDEEFEFCVFAEEFTGIGLLITAESFLTETEYYELLKTCHTLQKEYQERFERHKKCLTRHQTFTKNIRDWLEGIGKNKAYEIIHNGELPAIKIGNKLLIPKTVLIDFLGNEKKYLPVGSATRKESI